MTIIYEVNLKIDPVIKESFLDWLQHHIADMVKLPGFTSATLYEEKPCGSFKPDKDFVVQYQLESLSALENYFSRHAESMRNDGLKRFGEQFSATRRVMCTVV